MLNDMHDWNEVDNSESLHREGAIIFEPDTGSDGGGLLYENDDNDNDDNDAERNRLMTRNTGALEPEEVPTNASRPNQDDSSSSTPLWGWFSSQKENNNNNNNNNRFTRALMTFQDDAEHGEGPQHRRPLRTITFQSTSQHFDDSEKRALINETSNEPGRGRMQRLEEAISGDRPPSNDLHKEGDGDEQEEDNPFSEALATQKRQSTFQFDFEDNTTTLPLDIFTMMFFANFNSYPFITGAFVFCMQMTILILLSTDMLADDSPDGKQDENILNVPPAVDNEVLVAQAFALFIAVLSNTDLTDSLTVISIGYRPSLMKRFPSATYPKFVAIIALHMFLGFCTIGANFVLIVQSLTVLDIFLNFAALSFIEHLDSWTCSLAKQGWLGTPAMKFVDEMEKTTIEYDPRKEYWLRWAKPAFIALLQWILFATFLTVVKRQTDGTLLERTSCTIIEVNFGDDVYPLTPRGIRFETEMVNGTRRLPGSERALGKNFNGTKPPDLHYAYFSANYHIRFSGNGDRPAYYERNSEDLSAGMFYYCEGESAWVFTIRSLIPTGAIPQGTLRRCPHGWLMRSPRTEAFTLDEAPQENWHIWTGVLGFTKDNSGFRFFCAECESSMDCGLAGRGTCRASSCECRRAVAEGNFCEYDRSCDYLVVFFGGDSSSQGRRFGPYTNFRRGFGDQARVYGRSVYFLGKEIIMYTGRRWYDVIYEEEYPFHEVEDFAKLHAFWDSILLANTWWYSDPTEENVPTGRLGWYQIPANASAGNYGPFGYTFDVNQRFECLSVNCNATNVCGIGYCNRTAVVYERAAVTEAPTSQPTTFVGSEVPSIRPTFEPTIEITAEGVTADIRDEIALFPTLSPAPTVSRAPSTVSSLQPSVDIPQIQKSIQIIGGKCVCPPNRHGWFCEFNGPNPNAPTGGGSDGDDDELESDNDSKGDLPTTSAPTASLQPSVSMSPSVSPTSSSIPSTIPTTTAEPSISEEPTRSVPPSPRPTISAAPSEALLL